MKQLMDWLSNHTERKTQECWLTFFSAMAPKRTETTPVQYSAVSRNSPLISWTWEDRRYTRTSLLKANGAHFWRRGTYRQVLITPNPASQHTCVTSSPNSSAAGTATERLHAPATRVTLLLPGKQCERDKKCQQSNMSPPASPNHSTQTKTHEEDSLSHLN